MRGIWGTGGTEGEQRASGERTSLSSCAGALPLEYHVRRSSSVGSSFDASAASFI